MDISLLVKQEMIEICIKTRAICVIQVFRIGWLKYLLERYCVRNESSIINMIQVMIIKEIIYMYQPIGNILTFACELISKIVCFNVHGFIQC